MANEENLIPINQRTKSEQREIASKAGKASGRARRDNRTFRETWEQLLPLMWKDKDGKLSVNPVTGKPMSVREKMAFEAFRMILKGNVKALQTVLDVLGERVIKSETDIKLKADKYDKMSEEELQAEARRLLDSITNP